MSTRDNRIAGNFVVESMNELLDKMAFVNIEPREPYWTGDFIFEKELAGRLFFSGPVSGVFLINCSAQFIREATSNLLGIEGAEVNEEQLFDTLKEFVNMVTGSVLHKMDSEKSLAKLGIPECRNVRVAPFDESAPCEVMVCPFTFYSITDNAEDALFLEIALR